MHKFSMPEEIIARVVARVGRTHPFDKLEASKCLSEEFLNHMNHL
ncbi:MAG TPA: hypothetical protein VNO32_26020 [Candidatus Acidoferrum sp.]|nr:hypothetical protein [Candidatus Acidoferrum sp.]